MMLFTIPALATAQLDVYLSCRWSWHIICVLRVTQGSRLWALHRLLQLDAKEQFNPSDEVLEEDLGFI
jgi:hypothetical protein